MANIVFIAVQCCQCSTMQAKIFTILLFSLTLFLLLTFFCLIFPFLSSDVPVLTQVKQQKRSSNSWTCSVCNQKQSVRKVFAQGFIAKDIRKFVQAFNVSCKFVDEGSQVMADCEVTSPELNCGSTEIEEEKKKKRRVDWNEYMDDDNLQSDEFRAGLEGQELEPKIVTEWPDEFSENPKPKRNKGFMLNESKTLQQGKGVVRKSKETVTNEGSIHTFEDTRQSEKAVAAKSRSESNPGGSKWEQYIIEEKDDKQSSGERNILNCRYESDKEVEEDIHPDFL